MLKRNALHNLNKWTFFDERHQTTGLRKAVLKGDIYKVKHYLECGANINAIHSYESRGDKWFLYDYQRKPLDDGQHYTILSLAIRKNNKKSHFEIIRLLLKAGANVYQSAKYNGNNSLIEAISCEDGLELVELLLEANDNSLARSPNEIALLKNFYETVLTLAVTKNKPKLVRLSLKYGADPSFTPQGEHIGYCLGRSLNVNSRTLEEVAIQNNFQDIIKIFQEQKSLALFMGTIPRVTEELSIRKNFFENPICEERIINIVTDMAEITSNAYPFAERDNQWTAFLEKQGIFKIKPSLSENQQDNSHEHQQESNKVVSLGQLM